MMQTPGPGDQPTVLGSSPGGAGMQLGPDPSGGGRMPLKLPAQPQSWGLDNPTLPSQLTGWLRNYYGGVGSLDAESRLLQFFSEHVFPRMSDVSERIQSFAGKVSIGALGVLRVRNTLELFR